VPLSEGRVEDDGTLLCSYHAWRFDGKGECVSVPQISSQTDLERIKASPKTSCNAFPTRVLNGVLFVWPSSDETAILESELIPVTYRQAEGFSDRLWEGPWNFRELPYGADVFLENVVDLAHVGVSHHNIVGNRCGSQERTLETVSPVTNDGFSVLSKSPNSENPDVITFHAPSLVAIDAPAANGVTLELYCSPS